MQCLLLGRVGKTQILDRVIHMVTKAIASGIVSPADPPDIENELESDEDVGRAPKRGRRRPPPVEEVEEYRDLGSDRDPENEEEDRIKSSFLSFVLHFFWCLGFCFAVLPNCALLWFVFVQGWK